jgi:hypothetical protein
MSILSDKNSEIERLAALPCNNATLTLAYKREENNQMRAYMTIEKSNQSITFKFSIHTFQEKKDGQIITKVIQSGLGAFAATIEGYLTGIGAGRHLSKLPDDYGETKDENQQQVSAAGNNDGYAKSNTSSFVTF